MRNEVAALVLVVLVAGSLGMGYLAGSSNRQTATTTITVGTTVTVGTSSCSTPFNLTTPFNNNSANHPLLVASAGTTGAICLEYSNTYNNSISDPIYFAVLQYFKGGIAGVCTGPLCNVKSIQVVASQRSVNFTPSANPSDEIEDVTYTVTIPSNVTEGAYGIQLYEFCSLFPLFVEPNNGSVAIPTSEFTPWYPHTGSCEAQVVGARVLGVSGFTVLTQAVP